jgi:hypothetical protein
MSFPERLTGIGHRGRVEQPRDRDVLDLIPPTDDIRHLEHVWGLTEESSPVARLLMWHPTDEGDRAIRAYLIAFAQRVIFEDRKGRQPFTGRGWR